MTSNPLRIAVVILNWNGKDDTLECLDSVREIDYPDFVTVVVDNGSSDGSVQAIKAAHPNIIVLETGENLGYAGGNNVGIRWALERNFDGVLLLNNDTIIHKEILRAFAAAHHEFPNAGAFGAKIFYYGSGNTIWFAGGVWDQKKLMFRHIGLGEPDGPEFSQVRTNDYITGCALYVRADVLRRIGLLDEELFLTYEETDWCYRARESGYDCLYIPDAIVWHKVSASFGGASSPLVNYFMTRNKLLWASKHLPWVQRTRLHIQTLRTLRKILLPPFMHENMKFRPTLMVHWAVQSWRRNLATNLSDPQNQSTLMAIRDYFTRRFGNCPPAVRQLGRQ